MFYMENSLYYQLGQKYAIQGILVLIDFTSSNVLLSLKICFSKRIYSTRLSLVCTKYLETDIFSAIQI